LYIKDNKEIFSKLLIKCRINVPMFFIIMSIINEKKNNYNKSYCDEYKLIMILQMEDDCNKWITLTTHIFYSPNTSKSENHYKAIHSQYLRWCRKKVFIKAYKTVLPVKTNNVNNDVNECHY